MFERFVAYTITAITLREVQLVVANKNEMGQPVGGRNKTWRMANGDGEWGVDFGGSPTAQWLPCILNIELFSEFHT
jgi:hypothetical protein